MLVGLAIGDKPPTQPNNPPAAPNIPQGSWDYTLAMLGISPAGDALVTPKILPDGGGLPKSVLFKPSNKPAAESTEFKWTEEGMAKLFAANLANKVTPPIPPLDIMVREQSLPTTSRTVTVSDRPVEESNREIDPIKNLSDNELKAAFGSVTSGIKYIFSGPDEHGAKIIEEHKKRFPKAEGQRNIEALGERLSFINPVIKVGVEKITGTKLPGEVDPTDFIPKRVGLPTIRGKVVKDTAPKPKIIEGKAIDLNTPQVPGTSGLSKEPHLPTHTSDITAKTKIVENPSMLANKIEQKLPTSSTNILYKKQYIDTVEKINDRYPINADLAGQKYPINKLPEHIQLKYPDSVMVDEKGLMRFEPYTFTDKLGRVYRIESDNLTGKRDIDSKIANEIMGIKEKPEDHTWHHVEDGRTMIAIPTDLHDAIKHTGGAAVKRAEMKK